MSEPSAITAQLRNLEDTTLLFVDRNTLPALACAVEDRLLTPAQLALVFAICDDEPATAFAWLRAHPWLSHVVSAATLRDPIARALLDNVSASLAGDGRTRALDAFGPGLTAHRARVLRASEGIDRLDRMNDFLMSSGVALTARQLLAQIAEQLIANAFYAAPLAAGVVQAPIKHTLDVSLPEDSACELLYGCADGCAVVRVRDPFGALSRSRLVETLVAEGGLTRAASQAMSITISVVEQHHTDVLVSVSERDRSVHPRPFALHLFFKRGTKRRFWSSHRDHSGQCSFTASPKRLGVS